MTIYGIVQWKQWEDGSNREEWYPDFDTIELFSDEGERDKRLLELDGPALVRELNNLKETWGPDDEYINFEDSLDEFEWNGFHPERHPCSFKNINGEPVKDGPYVPFLKETGRCGEFWWQINAHFYQDGKILNYVTDHIVKPTGK